MPRKHLIREFISTVQTLFAAAAYAEAGELGSARRIIGERPGRHVKREEESRLGNAERITMR